MIYLGYIKITFSRNVLITSLKGGSSLIAPSCLSLTSCTVAVPCVFIFCWPSVNLYCAKKLCFNQVVKY